MYLRALKAQRKKGFYLMKANDPPYFAPNEDVQFAPQMFKMACTNLGYEPTIDLFTWPDNAQLPRFITTTYRPEACGTNAFTYNWAEEKGYANPPWSLMSKVLEKVCQ